MKTIILLLLAVSFSVSTRAQKISADKVPASVMSAFKAKSPAATDVEWEMENASEYEVEFESNKVEQSMKFDKDGKWLETETEIKVASLPEAVKQAIAKQFAGFKINEACKMEHVQYGSCFEAEIKKGKETFDVIVNAKGEVLSKISESEKDEDDDDKGKNGN